MQHNDKLNRAKDAKNDEFYTRYADIEAEVNAYVGHDPHVFENKTILLPCDDPDRSNFAGLMGVPITFLDRYNPEQFEMLGKGRDMDLPAKTGMPAEFLNDYFAQGGTGSMQPGHPDLCYYDADGKAVVPYRRIMLRHKKTESRSDAN